MHFMIFEAISVLLLPVFRSLSESNRRLSLSKVPMFVIPMFVEVLFKLPQL